MGSLPNLHELSDSCKISHRSNVENELLRFRDRYNEQRQNLQTGGNRKNSNHGCHKPLFHTQSLGSNPHDIKLIRKFTTEKFPAQSRICRNIRSSSVIPCQFYGLNASKANRRISRQASVTNSTGASSVQKLIAVVRSTPSEYGPVYSRQGIQQHFVTLCLVHGIFTIAYIPIVILQSSVSSWSWPSEEISNSNGKGTGPISNVGSLLLSLLYFASALSAIPMPFICHKIGITRSLTAAYFITTAFLAAHLYPKLLFLWPCYMIMGISISCIIYARTAYMGILASKLKLVPSIQEENEIRCNSTNTTKEMIVVKLFGLITMVENICLVLGGIVTYFLIQLTNGPSNKSNSNTTSNNDMLEHFVHPSSKYSDQICGYNSCPTGFLSSSISERIRNLIPNKNYLVFPCKTSTMLTAVFIGCSVVCTVVCFLFIHRIRMRYHYSQTHRVKFSNMIYTIFNTFKNKQLLLMMPLMIFIGMEQGFMYADFTKLYVICVIGVESTPLIFISLGLLQSLATITISLLLNHIRRYYIVGNVVGFIFQSCLLLVLIIWKPTSDDAALFYVISSAWGVCNAIWDTLSFCLIMALFQEHWEFAFSQNQIFKYMGLTVAFMYHEHLCTSVKLYIMCGMLLVSVIPYTWLEIQLYSKQNIRLPK